MNWKESIRNQIQIRNSATKHWEYLIINLNKSQARVFEMEETLRLASLDGYKSGDKIALEEKNNKLITELYQLQKDKSERISREVTVYVKNQELEKENHKLLVQVKILDSERSKYVVENQKLVQRIRDLHDEEIVSLLEFNCLSDEKERLLEFLKTKKISL